MKSYIDNVVYLNLLTTGKSIDNDFIFKIDGLKINNNKETYFSSFINIPSEALCVNSNFFKEETLENLSKAPLIENIMDDFKDFLSDCPIIIFNNQNQQEFLKKLFSSHSINFNNTILDCFELFMLLEPWHNDYSLEGLLLKKSYKEKPLEDISSEDLLSLFNLFLEENDIGDFISHYGVYLKNWSFYDYLVNFNISEEMFKDKLYRNTDFYEESNKTLELKENCEEILKDPRGFSSLNNKFKFRQGQYDVMKTVRSSLEKNLISIMEAPTGTGKSIAYLLPAITKAYYKGQKIFISTNTKELQRQLVHKDIPFLLKSFNLNSKIDVINIKGKSNYLCMELIQSILNDNVFNNTRSLKENMALVYLHRYCYKGKAGDKEEITSEAESHLNLKEAIKHCLCDSDGCNIKACPYECYYKNTVEALKTSTIVILNHSLLLKWPYDSIIENVIIDEAHNLSDAIFDAYAAILNSSELKSLLLEILDYKNKKGYLNYIWKYTPNRTTNFRELVRDKIDVSFLTIDRITYLVSKEQRESYDLDVSFSKEKFLSYGKVVHELKVLKEDLIDLYKPLNSFIETNNLDNNKTRNLGEIFIKKVERIKELIDFIDIFTTVEQDENKCYGFFIEKNKKFWECYIKDLNSSLIFFERFLNNLKSCSFLSATLKNNGTYKSFKNSLAIDKANNNFLKELEDIPQSFDLKNRSIIYNPIDCPKYFEPGFIDFMVSSTIKILENSNCNLLILFTSKKRLIEFKNKILPFTSTNKINLFEKKQDIKKLSLKGSRSILLGSKGFFEGIDIPGDLLNMVLIDKMPNINPYNPLFEKFIENGFAFNTINTPRATISFKQCFGRLIRTELDYGYFIIFDKCNQNTILGNVSKEYKGVKTISAPINNLLRDIPLRFKYWNSLNIDLVISSTIRELENFLKTHARGIYGNNAHLELALNDFYEEKFQELNIKKRFHISTKNKKLNFIYEDNSYLNLKNKTLIIKVIFSVFN